MNTLFAIPGLMHPPELDPPAQADVHVVERDILVLPIEVPQSRVEVAILDRTGTHLFRKGLETTSLQVIVSGAHRTWRLRWTVDLPANDYMLEITVDDVVHPLQLIKIEHQAGTPLFCHPTPTLR